MDDQLETISEQHPEHRSQCLWLRAGRRERRQVETVQFEPGRPAHHLFGFHAVSGTDQAEHGGVADLIAIAAQEAAARAATQWIGRGGATSSRTPSRKISRVIGCLKTSVGRKRLRVRWCGPAGCCPRAESCLEGSNNRPTVSPFRTSKARRRDRL